ncbi:hypothetical protein ACG92U_02575 [Leuconostoc citreum]
MGKEIVKVESQLNNAQLDERQYQQLLMMRQTILQEISIEKMSSVILSIRNIQQSFMAKP